MTDKIEDQRDTSFARTAAATMAVAGQARSEIAAALGAAVDRLTLALDDARRPGKPLDQVARLTREAPLGALFVAFLAGVAFARRR